MEAEAPEIVGSVRDTKFWSTKKICDWQYDTPMLTSSPLIEKLGPPVCTVNLETMPSDTRKRLIDAAGDAKAFVARSNWFGSGRAIDGIWARSLEELEKLVEKAFADRIIAASQVKWSDWLEVQVHGRGNSDGEDKRDRSRYAGLTIAYKRLKRAKFPDGRDMVLDGSSLYPFPKAKKAGEDRDRFSSGYYQDSDDQFAYIPATEENVRALDDILANIVKLRGVLEALLGQKNIATQLERISTLRLELKR